MAYITTEDILAQTNQGLDIILHFYPQASRAVEDKNFKFTIRDEKTPSAILTKGKTGVWGVMDFGDKKYSAFDVVIKEMNLEFKAACRWIEGHFNIAGETGTVVSPEATKKTERADDSLEVGTRQWVIKESPSVYDCKVLFSKYVWQHLQKNPENGESPDDCARRKAIKLFDRYNLNVLESSSIVFKDKKSGAKMITTFCSTDTYPIYMYQEETWQKFYEPLSKDYRFYSYGDKPKDYMFGEQHIKDVTDNDGIDEDDDYEKLQDIIICTGGSDALNVAALGYVPVWFNSETVHPSSIPIYKLKKWAHRIYNLPDIDSTGKRKADELANYHLEIHTIYLPEELLKIKSGKRDSEGSPKFCKDVRDYFNRWGDSDFRNLMKNAYPLRFWNETNQLDKNGKVKLIDGLKVKKFTPNPTLILNFLFRHGFGIIITNNGTTKEFVRVDNSVVSKVEGDDVRKYIDNFLQAKNAEIDLKNAFYRAKDLNDSTLDRLPYLDLDFKDFEIDTQYLFFSNEIWKVTKSGIELVKETSEKRFVWEHEVVRPKLWDPKTRREVDVKASKIEEEGFKITKNEDGELDINFAENRNNPFLNFLINTSRIHWRKELEDRLDSKPSNFQEEYKEKNRFNIAGELLTQEEIKEQKQHLIAKICALGYEIFRYKDRANTYALWSMDYCMKDSEKSQGGTGKSIFGKAVIPLMQTVTLDGRDRNLTQNKHIFENVTEYTDLVLLDDGNKYLDFGFFFAMVTSFITVNPKGTKSFSLPFEKSPKLHITSNFPPIDSDESTLRRIWFLAFSDYYHYNTSGDYREQRLPLDEFGKNLFQNFEEDEWNEFFNFAALCVKSYMEFGKVEPPMQELMANTYRNKLGPNFMSWANIYFNEENQTINSYIHRKQVFDTYKMDVSAEITPNTFKDKLSMYCRMKGWNLNPKNILYIQEGGRILKKIHFQPVWDTREKFWRTAQLPNPQTEEFFYIQTEDKEFTKRGLAKFEGNTEPDPFVANDPKKELDF
jgi:hypothetical protein